MINRAREIQQVVMRCLLEESRVPYTDVEEWTATQAFLARSIGGLLKQEGSTPNEEGERLLAILMGYTIAVRNRRNIAVALEQAERVIPQITDKLLKCKLAVYCYGECLDEELGMMAHRFIEEQKLCGNPKEVACLEELLMNFSSVDS